MRRHLISVSDLSKNEVEHMLQIADSFLEIGERPIKKVPTLRGHTIINLFYEPSTRTRTSFELAAKRLSADVVNITAGSSAVAKGESLKDTGKTLSAMGVDAVVIRHPSSGSPNLLSKWTNALVINAGDGTHEHPTQALLDLYTLKKQFGGLEKINGLKMLITGDILHSRVARSNILLLSSFGVDITVVAPKTLIPVGIESLGCKVSYSMDKVISSADIMYLLRMQLERQDGSRLPSLREYAVDFGLNTGRLREAKKSILIMHPGPINRGVEISSDVADNDNVLITDQVENGMAVRMAVLFALLGGESRDD